MTYYALLGDGDSLVGVVDAQPNPDCPYTVLDLGETDPSQGDEWFDTIQQQTVKTGATWNPSTRTFTALSPRQIVDRIQDLADDPGLVQVWQSLNATQRTVLRNRLALLLGRLRYRYGDDPVDLPEGND